MSSKYRFLIQNTLFKAQGGRCFYCKREMYLGRPGVACEASCCTIDHMVSRANGGLDMMENFAGACAECNGLKGSLNAEVFQELMIATNGDKKRLKNLCLNAMKPLSPVAPPPKVHNGPPRWINRTFPSKSESLLDRAWENILRSRASATGDNNLSEVMERQAAVAQR